MLRAGRYSGFGSAPVSVRCLRFSGMRPEGRRLSRFNRFRDPCQCVKPYCGFPRPTSQACLLSTPPQPDCSTKPAGMRLGVQRGVGASHAAF